MEMSLKRIIFIIIKMMFVRLVKPIIALKCYSQYSRCHSHTTNETQLLTFMLRVLHTQCMRGHRFG